VPQTFELGFVFLHHFSNFFIFVSKERQLLFFYFPYLFFEDRLKLQLLYLSMFKLLYFLLTLLLFLLVLFLEIFLFFIDQFHLLIDLLVVLIILYIEASAYFFNFTILLLL
jgi:hypothetical protein